MVIGLGIGGVQAFASPAQGEPSTTTLDACGYFTGTQTPAMTSTAGSSTTERGTWTGVLNNYGGGPVASLGKVQGAYVETTSVDAEGTTHGVESFTSNAGKIDQSFSYGPGVPGGFVVTVQATRDLSFLTSDTDGHCYSGTFPRP